MANVIIEELIIQADKAGSLAEVKKSLKDIKGAMLSIGDEGSEDFKKLASAAAELKDRVEDTNAAIARTNPDKFNGLASASKIAATGIQLTTGAMALFGSESEDVQKALMKVQAAMMFAEGLQNIQELEKDFIKLGNTIKANPIFAIAAVLIAIGTSAYAMYENYKEANSEAAKLKAIAEETKKVGEQQISVMDNELRIMTAQGASAFDIHKKEQEILAEKIKITQASLAHAHALVKEQEQTTTLWEDTQKMMNVFNQNKVLQDAVDKKLAQDKADRIQKAKDDEIAIQNELNALKADVVISDAKFEASMVDNAKKASDEKLEIWKKEQALRDQYRRENTDADFLAFEDYARKQQELMENNIISTDEYNKNVQEKHDEIFGKFTEIQKKAVDDVMVVQQYHYTKELETATRLSEFKKSLLKTDVQGAISNTAQMFGSLAELSKKHAKLSKGFAVAQASINTFQGVSKALASMPPPFNFIAAAAALAAGLVQVRNILAVKEDGGGGGASSGGGVGSQPSFGGMNEAPQGIQPSTQLDENGNVIPQTQPQQQSQQVYMVESQATGVINNVAMIESAVKFH